MLHVSTRFVDDEDDGGNDDEEDHGGVAVRTLVKVMTVVFNDGDGGCHGGDNAR